MIDRRNALFASAALMASRLGGSATEWPGFLGPRRDASLEEDLVAWKGEGPRELWSFPVGEGFSGLVVSEKLEPASDGPLNPKGEKKERLVLFHRGKEGHICESLDAASGRVMARAVFETRYEDPLGRGNGPRSTPALSDGKLFLVTPEASLIAVQAGTLKELWRVDLAGKYQMPPGFFGYGVSPLIHGGKILLNVGGDGAGIVAFSTNDGSEQWKVGSQQASYSSGVMMRLDGLDLATFLTREGFLAADPTTGKVIHQMRWRSRQNASVNAASPVEIPGGVFLSACYGTGAIALKVADNKLERLWSNDDSLSCHFSTPVQWEGHLYGFHGRQEEGGELRCVETTTGKVRWKLPGTGCGWVIRGKSRLLVMQEDGNLLLMEASREEPRILAKHRLLKGTPRALPAFSRGVLYCRDDKVLTAVRLAG